MEYLKEEIAKYQLEELEKAELERLRGEVMQLQAKNSSNFDTISRLKKENADLARDVIVLN